MPLLLPPAGRALLALVVSASAAAALVRSPRSQSDGEHQRPLLPRVELIEGLGAGYKSLLADYYWIQTLQAVASAQTPDEYLDIYDYAKVVIALDPRFRPIYAFAGATLPAQDHSGIWHNTQESIEILERGVQEFPDFVFLRILLAYDLNAYAKEPTRAATILADAARMKGAPRYLRSLAAHLFDQAGDFDTGLAFARSLAGTADEATRPEFEHRMHELELHRLLSEIDLASADFERRQGHRPGSLQDLVSAGLLREVPNDPLGGQLVIGQDGKCRSTAESENGRLPSQRP